MKITDHLGLPQPIVDAVKNDPYHKGEADFSVTELIQPPRLRSLYRKHHDEISEDASDRIWSLFGQLAHLVFERANTSTIAEERFFMDIEVDGKTYKISGSMDVVIPRGPLSEGLLQDYKYTTRYSLAGDLKKEWIAQQNIYVHLLALHKYDIDRAEIVVIARDWSKRQARLKKTPDYPQKPVAIRRVPLWGKEKTIEYIKERIRLHVAAEKHLPECDSEDRWQNESTYAVMKKGGKKALSASEKVFIDGVETAIPLTKERAEEIAEVKRKKNKKDTIYVEYRPGENKRCEDYCAVRNLCDQFKELKKLEPGSAANVIHLVQEAENAISNVN